MADELDLRHLVWGKFDRRYPDGTVPDTWLVARSPEWDPTAAGEFGRLLWPVATAIPADASDARIILPSAGGAVYIRFFDQVPDVAGRPIPRFQAVVLSANDLCRLGWQPWRLDRWLAAGYLGDRLDWPAGADAHTAYVDKVAAEVQVRVPLGTNPTADQDGPTTTAATAGRWLAAGYRLYATIPDGPNEDVAALIRIGIDRGCGVGWNLPPEPGRLAALDRCGIGVFGLTAVPASAPDVWRDWEYVRNNPDTDPNPVGRVPPVRVAFTPPIPSPAAPLPPDPLPVLLPPDGATRQLAPRWPWQFVGLGLLLAASAAGNVTQFVTADRARQQTEQERERATGEAVDLTAARDRVMAQLAALRIEAGTLRVQLQQARGQAAEFQQRADGLQQQAAELRIQVDDWEAVGRDVLKSELPNTAVTPTVLRKQWEGITLQIDTLRKQSLPAGTYVDGRQADAGSYEFQIRSPVAGADRTYTVEVQRVNPNDAYRNHVDAGDQAELLAGLFDHLRSRFPNGAASDHKSVIPAPRLVPHNGVNRFWFLRTGEQWDLRIVFFRATGGVRVDLDGHDDEFLNRLTATLTPDLTRFTLRPPARRPGK